jgi:hypothetical protein
VWSFFCQSKLHYKVELFTATGKLSVCLVESFLIAAYYRYMQCCTLGFSYSLERVNVFALVQVSSFCTFSYSNLVVSKMYECMASRIIV